MFIISRTTGKVDPETDFRNMICRRSRINSFWRRKTAPAKLQRTLSTATTTSSHKDAPNLAVNTSEGNYEAPFVIFDTVRSSKCRLTSKRKNILTWYSCGPTVYDSCHIGHASSFIRQDVIRRIMESLGRTKLSVVQVMGVTDIDDKIILKANQTGKEWSVVSRHYEEEFKEDLGRLNVIPPHMFTRVSDYIPQILQFVGKLVNSGFAYPVADGSVYFDTDKYGSRYGKFRQVVDEQEAEQEERETSGSSGKRNVKDFALWKGAKPEEPYWTSPWGSGRGRPGWHIECSVMASHIFGSNLDLHTGGKDLIFPHHENEEAQCCAHFDSNHWTSHWLHMGHLHFKGDVKMSKSLGNTVSIPQFLSQNSPDVLRMLSINSRYRKDLEFSPDSVDIGKKLLKKFKTFLNDTEAIMDGSKLMTLAEGHDDASLWNKLTVSTYSLNQALFDDFDTPEAIKILIDFMSEFNRYHVPANDTLHSAVDYGLVLASKNLVSDFLGLVGFLEFSKHHHSISHSSFSDSNYTNLINQFVKFRKEVRSFSLATDEPDKETRKAKIRERKSLLNACDTIRNELIRENNIEIKDHGKSSSWSFVDVQEKNSQ